MTQVWVFQAGLGFNQRDTETRGQVDSRAHAQQQQQMVTTGLGGTDCKSETMMEVKKARRVIEPRVEEVEMVEERF